MTPRFNTRGSRKIKMLKIQCKNRASNKMTNLQQRSKKSFVSSENENLNLEETLRAIESSR